ncbi:hypothetical protein NC653_021898 [Populus alba x Populus x berolinensis]|uniref:Uncharacterized protein n=1 Tax=Populus alba x Populus x berolinensis TaxID=444605 RepID=A0AAD6MQW2_9ROSI|nr:hypothetical protein NC653_021892 [Populus alba x Populus x berolinensis]KAJ6989153.1 hypothetical protein NC653_021898 [Populus alba x Populus x berolinensis]
MKSSPINSERVQKLPKLCQLQVTLPSGPKVDCS